MEILAWGLVLVLAVVVGWLVLRRPPPNPYPEALARLEAELREDALPEGGGATAADPAEVRRIREVLGAWSEGGHDEEEGDPAGRALAGILRYLDRAVLPGVREGLRGGGAGEALEDAVDALEDLAFYARTGNEEPAVRDNLAQVVQSVTREYTMETGVPLKVRGPERPVSVTLAPEAFKDALFLVLSNAGRFGGGRTVELVLEAADGRGRVSVLDRGPGFGAEAYERAFDPFWTTEADALGLGLTHARQLIEGMGGRLRLANREGGGAEVEITLPG